MCFKLDLKKKEYFYSFIYHGHCYMSLTQVLSGNLNDEIKIGKHSCEIQCVNAYSKTMVFRRNK